MSKLENISALLVATNSAFTKEAAFTTKTTRAELIRMLQATDSAVLEALEVYENYVKLSEQVLEDKENLQAKCSELEAKLVITDQQLTNCSLKNQELKFRVSEQQAELVATNKELADSKLYTAALQHQVHKYKQQGFFDRLFGRTPK